MHSQGSYQIRHILPPIFSFSYLIDCYSRSMFIVTECIIIAIFDVKRSFLSHKNGQNQGISLGGHLSYRCRSC